jgi:Zn-dependent peptidase ImmA (M78 family)
MNRRAYYEGVRSLAREVRAKYNLTTPRVLRSDLRRIYHQEKVKVILWPYKLRKLNGAYFFDDLGATVMLRKDLPAEPMVFTMGHELKHHLADREAGHSYCDVSNETNYIEIGAEIFAAELIFPEEEFAVAARSIGIRQGCCSPELLVRLKHETKTTMHYASMVKRVVFLGFAPATQFVKVGWRKLEERIIGPTFRRR